MAAPGLDGSASGMRGIAAIWLGWAILILAFPVFVHARFELHRPDRVFTWTQEATAQAPNPDATGLERILDMHLGWDSSYYLSIAERGYDDPQMRSVAPDATPETADVELKADQPTWTTFNYAFFPAYPLAIRALSWPLKVFGQSQTVTDTGAAVLISLFGTLAAMLALYDLGRQKDRPDDGRRAAFYLLVWPASAFLAQVYTEGLFCGLSFAALAMLGRRRWLWAAALAMLATWTRATGALLLVPFAWTWLADGGLKVLTRRPTLRDFAGMALAAAPAIAWLVWRLTLGDKFALVETHYFGRNTFALKQSWDSWVLAWRDLTTGNPQVRAYDAVEFFAVAVGLGTSLLMWRRDRALSLYSLAIVVVALTSGPAMGMHRYVLSVPALFLVPARWGRGEAFDRSWTLGGALVMAIFAITFSFGYWAG